MPITMREILSLHRANIPIAKSHPQAIEIAISDMFLILRKNMNSNRQISTTAIEIDNMLSFFIC